MFAHRAKKEAGNERKREMGSGRGGSEKGGLSLMPSWDFDCPYCRRKINVWCRITEYHPRLNIEKKED
jgi:hypothetical protein